MKEKQMIPPLCVTESAGIFEDILQRGISLSVRATGKSMTPFLSGGEILTIRRVSPASLSIGDLIFFKTREGVPLIHRITKKQQEADGFIFHTKGDSLFVCDAPVGEGLILGKVCGVRKVDRNGNAKEINMESRPQRCFNYMTAISSLAKTRLYAAAAKGLPPVLRIVIKKVFL
jgi:signal peptidase I